MWDRYRDMYTDVWKLHKEHFGNPDWDRFVDEMEKIGQKYDDPFCASLLIAVAEDLHNGERRKSE